MPELPPSGPNIRYSEPSPLHRFAPLYNRVLAPQRLLRCGPDCLSTWGEVDHIGVGGRWLAANYRPERALRRLASRIDARA